MLNYVKLSNSGVVLLQSAIHTKALSNVTLTGLPAQARIKTKWCAWALKELWCPPSPPKKAKPPMMIVDGGAGEGREGEERGENQFKRQS